MSEIKTPIEMMLDGVVWKAAEQKPPSDGSLHATHEGVLELFGKKMRCYRLSNGQAVFHAGDFEEFFEELLA